MPEDFQTYQLPRWEELPTIALYMDQVILLLNDSIGILADSPVKPAMINNYVKLKLLPPPEKKKYDRDRLARLVMISILRRSLTISEAGTLAAMLAESMGAEQAYNLFAERLEHTLHTMASGGTLPITDAQSNKYLDAALLCLAGKLLVEQLLEQSTNDSESKPE